MWLAGLLTFVRKNIFLIIKTDKHEEAFTPFITRGF